MTTVHGFAIAMIAGAVLLSNAGAVSAAEPPSAKAYADQILSRSLWKDEHTGELWCWHARYGLPQLVQGYRAYGDTAWLDQAVRAYDTVLGKMETGPDGYKGFIGPYIYDTSVWCDVHIGDAIMLGPLMAFAELVLVDEKDELAERYGDAARRYVAVTRKHLIEKWHARGTWRTDGPYGWYVYWNTFGDPGELQGWTVRDDIKIANMSMQFNKLFDVALAALRIDRCVGDPMCRDVAERVFRTFRSRMQYFDDHYVWNYWEPLGPWDVDLAKRDTVHWVQVHPFRNYQAGEVAEIAGAFDRGVVFSAEDIRRIVNTNVKVMWNGDLQAPAFANSNAAHKAYMQEPKSGKGRAGTLWTALLPYSETVRKIQLARRADRDSLKPHERITRDYRDKVILSRPASLERRDAPEGEAEVFDFPTTECPDLHMAAVLPSTFKQGDPVIVISKAWMPDELKIELVSADGKRVIRPLHQGRVPGGSDGHAGIFIYEWDTTPRPGPDAVQELKGGYRVRWTFRGGTREFPITITE